MSKPITAWSYSRLSTYQKCPRQFKYKVVDRLPEPPNPAFEKGNRLDKMAESFVLGKITGMPKELRPFAKEMRELKRQMATPQHDLSVARNWSPSYSTDWNRVWCRSKLDATVVHDRDAVVIDYKTGRIYEDAHEMQGKLYATCAFAHFPDVQTVDVEFWYFDQDATLPFSYERAEFDGLKKYWEKAVLPMFRDRRYEPNPGDACLWCPFSKSKNGPCEY